MSKRKINLQQSEVAIREIRLGSITNYAGSAKELIEKSANGCLKEKKRPFSQCLGCSSYNAFCQLSAIRDVAVINHAPVGCSGDFYTFEFVREVGFEERGIRDDRSRFYSTNFKEKDTVFGGGEKLKATAREAYKRSHPKAIFITSSCASGIIGDDLDSIASELESELGIPVTPCYCEGFRSRLWTSGFDSAFHTILKGIVKPPRKKTNQVNIINFWGSHIFDDFLQELGYEAHYIVPYTSYDELEYISEAAATIQVCSTLGSYLGAALEQEYGVPEIRFAPAYGIKGTDTWIREVGKVLGREEKAEDYIERRHKEIEADVAHYREKLAGKKAYLAAGAAYGHSLAALLQDLGMELTGASIYHHDPIYDNEDDASDALSNTVKFYGDIPKYHVCNKQVFEMVNVLAHSDADVLIARHPGIVVWGAKLGLPTFIVEDEQYAFGYQGVLNYAEKILDTLETVEFTENLRKHSQIPYTDWWMQQDPFSAWDEEIGGKAVNE